MDLEPGSRRGATVWRPCGRVTSLLVFAKLSFELTPLLRLRDDLSPDSVGGFSFLRVIGESA